MIKEYKCQWCGEAIQEGEVVVIKPALFDPKTGKFDYDESQTIAVYQPDCWEEFVKHLPHDE